MRILLLAHRIPFPPNKGDKIRSFHLLEWLAGRHEVHLATLVDDADDLPGLENLRQWAKTVVYARIDQPGRKGLALRAVLQRQSVTVRHFYSRRLQSDIDALLDCNAVDVIVCFSSPMAEYVFRSRSLQRRREPVLKLMDLIDVDSYKWRQYAERSSRWIAWLYRGESDVLATYEQRIAKEFDRLYVVSDSERKVFPGDVTPGNLRAMSNGVDIDYFSPAHELFQPLRSPALVFTGLMDYWPNIEGVEWFVERILPRIRQKISAVEFYIVGARPHAAVKKLADSRGVTVTGFVDDVRGYLGSASVCVAPLRIARGIQNKVLEAMAMARPVVATSEAFEGIRADRATDIVIADGEQHFAEAVISLLEDAPSAELIGLNARRCMERRYRWQQSLSALEEVGL